MRLQKYRVGDRIVDAIQVCNIYPTHNDDPLWLALIIDSGGLDRRGDVIEAVFDTGVDRDLDPTEWLVHFPDTEEARMESDEVFRASYVPVPTDADTPPDMLQGERRSP